MSAESIIRLPVTLRSAPDEGRPPSLQLAGHLYGPPAAMDVPKEHRAKVFSASYPGLVVGHGAGSSAASHEEFCLEVARHGFVVLAVDFRGHGSSQGRGDGPLEHDLLAAAAFLRSRPAVDPTKVCYRGSSMGGFYGLKAAPLAGFAALVLLCPATEATMLSALERDEASDARWDRARLRAYFERQDALSLALKVDCPVLLIHARGDETVPLENSFKLARALKGEATLRVLQGGSHTSAQQDPEIHIYCAEWLCRALS